MSFFVKRGLLMKILSIGNSFSVDSQTWARKAAAAGGETFELGNLYIGAWKTSGAGKRRMITS